MSLDLAQDFDGQTYQREHDHSRLAGQMLRVYQCMRRHGWVTLDEIARITGDNVASISARLRDLRKEKFGSHTIERRPRGERKRGYFEYRLKLHEPTQQALL